MASTHVVLVRPESPANIGAVARIIRNTGSRGLRLVAPGDWRTGECWRTAWGAHEVLEQATVFESLDEALADAEYVVAFSGRREDRPAFDVREVGEQVAELGREAVACLVFGPERTGLTLAEIAQCGRVARIPSHPDQPSLNLSHAVMVAAYETYRARSDPPPERRWATHAEKEGFLNLLLAGLRSVEAIPSDNEDIYFRAWTELFQRADLTPREIQILEHMARKMGKCARVPTPR